MKNVRQKQYIKRKLTELRLIDENTNTVAEPVAYLVVDQIIYEKGDGNNQSRITVEKNYGYIGGSASGSKNGFMREFDKTFRKVYQYYGVTQKDIDNNTKRYIELVKTLARR